MQSRSELSQGAEEAVFALSSDIAYIDGAHELPVIFDRRYVDLQGVTSAKFSSATFAVSAYRDPGPEIGDILVIQGYNFRIARFEDGGDEFTMTAILDRLTEE